MKLLLIANAFPSPKQPSCSAWMRNIVDEIEAAGHEVDRIVIQGAAKNLPHRVWQYAVFFLRVFFARLDRYDGVYLHFPSHSSLSLLARRWRRAKLIVHLHGSDLLGKGRWPWLRRATLALLRAACRRADLVVVPSEFFAERLRETVIPKAIVVYPSGGVDRTRFIPEACSNRMEDVQYAPLRVGTVGRLIAGKGFDVLLRAVARCEHPMVVDVYGGGPERERLERLADELGIDDRVRFHGDTPQVQLAAAYASFDVFVFSTRLPESLGLVAVEAMACGVPVIGSQIGALPEYIDEGENGLLFPPGDDIALAGCLDRFAAFSLATLESMRRAAITTAAHYDRRTTTTALLATFQSLRDGEISQRRAA